MEENNYTAYQQPLSPDDHTPVKPKKKGKKGLIILIAVLVVVAAAAAILLPSLSSSPLALVAKGAEKTYTAMDQSELNSLFHRLEEGGSVDASLDLAPITQSLIGFGMNGRAGVTFYFGGGALGLDAVAELGGTPLLDASALLSTKELAVASQSLLGDQVYGANLEKLSENFDSSVFGPQGEYSLGVTAEEIQVLLDSFDSAKPSPEMEEDAKAILADFFLVVYNSLQAHGEIGKETGTLTYGGAEHATTTVTISMDDTDMVEFAADILEYVNTDPKLREFITNHARAITSALAYNSYEDMTEEEIVAEFYTAVEEALLALDDAREEAKTADLAATLTFHISKEGSYLVGMELNMTMDGETMQAGWIIGIVGDKLQELRFAADTPDGEGEFSYIITANDDSRFAAELKVITDETLPAGGSILWDKKSGALSVALASEYADFSMEGTLFHSEENTVLTVQSLQSDSEDMDTELGLTLTLTPGDKMTPIGAYTDVLTMSADEVDAVVSQLYMTFMQLFGVLG